MAPSEQPRHSHTFAPALGFDILTPLYAPMAKILQPVRRRLVERAAIEPGMDVLDLGCGPGDLVLLVKRAQPSASVVGLDVDPKIQAIARSRTDAAGADIDLRIGRIEDVDLPPGSFDRVLSSFVLHHLSDVEKLSALRAAHDLLRHGGQLHVLDIGRPHSALMRLAVPLYRLTHGSDRIAGNLAGRIPDLISQAGFVDIAEKEHGSSPVGELAFWSASRG